MGRANFFIFFVIACLAAFIGHGAGEAHATATAPVATTGMHDFDFLHGHWTVKNRHLEHRSQGRREWAEFEADDDISALPGGLGNEEHYSTDHWQAFHAIGLNLYEADTHQWALYWIDNRNSPGALQKPVRGIFTGNSGTFIGDDTLAGKPIRVRHKWICIDRNHVHWEQAFSADGGATWETNWTMDFTRN
jgi:hypothetical protein